jgi:adenine-specific DNA-methyltransferase
MQQASFALSEHTIFDHIADISQAASGSMTPQTKKKFAAYFTPKALSDHLIRIANYRGGKLGDHGAGAGILSATAAARYIDTGASKPCLLTAYEIQPDIQPFLKRTYDALSQYAQTRGATVDYDLQGDFTALATQALSTAHGDYDSIIINPPYFKIAANAPVNLEIDRLLGFRAPNIYAAFMLISLHLLKPNGSLTALVPRSFFNGAYFKPLRQYLKKIACIDSVTRYRSRSNLFKGDNVLQENCLVKFSRRAQQSEITVFTCEDPTQEATETMSIPADVLLENEHDIFLLPADEAELKAYLRIRALPHTLSSLGNKLSTGKLVEHRHAESLNASGEGALYIEAKCMDTSSRHYQHKHSPRNRGNALHITESTQKTLIDNQPLILLKRISSNSERRRVHASLLTAAQYSGEKLALSNSVQYLHGESLQTPAHAEALLSHLRSDDIELAMRAINGTTQINQHDFDLLRFPTLTPTH